MAKLSKELEKQIYDILGRQDISISYLSYGDIFENADPTYSVHDSNLNVLMDFSICTIWPNLVQYTIDLPKTCKIRYLVRPNAKKHRPAVQKILDIQNAIVNKTLQNNFGK